MSKGCANQWISICPIAETREAIWRTITVSCEDKLAACQTEEDCGSNRPCQTVGRNRDGKESVFWSWGWVIFYGSTSNDPWPTFHASERESPAPSPYEKARCRLQRFSSGRDVGELD
jgi:hypothetical protein